MKQPKRHMNKYTCQSQKTLDNPSRRNQQNVNWIHYPKPREASSLAHSCHKAGVKGNSSLIASLALLSFSISPMSLRIFMYCKKTTTNTHDKKSPKIKS